MFAPAKAEIDPIRMVPCSVTFANGGNRRSLKSALHIVNTRRVVSL